jgi:hypothetical protein
MAKIFISYARKDASEIAKELADRLRELNHEVFLDIQGIPGGSEWEKQLIQKAQWCDVLLVLITETSNQSKYVYDEFREAEKNKKAIIPIQVEDSTLPPHLTHLNVLPFTNLNYDGLLLKLEVAMRYSVVANPKNSLLRIVVPIAVILIIIVSAIFLLNNNNREQGQQTEVSVIDTKTAEATAFTNTNTDVPEIVRNTDIPNQTLTPTTILTPTSRPSTITPTTGSIPTDIPQERILYEETFDDPSEINIVPQAGTWSLIQESNGNNLLLGGHESLSSKVSIGSARWDNYIIELDFIVYDRIGPSADEFAICVRCSGAMSQGYIIKMGLTEASGHVFWEESNQSFMGETYGISIPSNSWNTLHIEVDGSVLRSSINGNRVSDVFDGSITQGEVYFGIGEGLSIGIDNIRVWSLDTND